MQDSTNPLLSIVTVVKDDVEGFNRTADSLRGQDLDRVEWVVIDSSGDAHEIPEAIERVGLVGGHHWTTPAGVYPAMNVGLAEAAGDYILFLNAGDALNSDAAAVIKRALGDAPTWLYGQVTFVAVSGGTVTPPAFDYADEKAALFSRGRFPPHQGTVVRTKTLRDLGGFDPAYRIAADYAAFLRLSLVSDPVEVPEVLAVFSEGGLSSVGWKEALREFHRARLEVLRPTGFAALRELAATTAHGVRVGVARGLGRVEASGPT